MTPSQLCWASLSVPGLGWSSMWLRATCSRGWPLGAGDPDQAQRSTLAGRPASGELPDHHRGEVRGWEGVLRGVPPRGIAAWSQIWSPPEGNARFYRFYRFHRTVARAVMVLFVWTERLRASVAGAGVLVEVARFVD